MSVSLNNILLDHLKKLKVKKNDKLVVHADLTKFGIINKNLPEYIVLNLIKLIGKNGSLVMPSYELDVPNNFIHHTKKLTKQTNISMLTKVFFKKFKTRKSKSLLHSHIGLGKHSKFLLKTPINTSFGKATDFTYFHKNNFKLILLGCSPQQGATYLHHIEALFGVPYRHWIKIRKNFLLKGKKRIMDYNYYARKNIKYKTNLNNFFKKMKRNNLKINKVKLKYGNSISVSIKHLHKISLKMLKKDPFIIVK